MYIFIKYVFISSNAFTDVTHPVFINIILNCVTLCIKILNLDTKRLVPSISFNPE